MKIRLKHPLVVAVLAFVAATLQGCTGGDVHDLMRHFRDLKVLEAMHKAGRWAKKAAVAAEKEEKEEHEKAEDLRAKAKKIMAKAKEDAKDAGSKKKAKEIMDAAEKESDKLHDRADKIESKAKAEAHKLKTAAGLAQALAKQGAELQEQAEKAEKAFKAGKKKARDTAFKREKFMDKAYEALDPAKKDVKKAKKAAEADGAGRKERKALEKAEKTLKDKKKEADDKIKAFGKDIPDVGELKEKMESLQAAAKGKRAAAEKAAAEVRLAAMNLDATEQKFELELDGRDMDGDASQEGLPRILLLSAIGSMSFIALVGVVLIGRKLSWWSQARSIGNVSPRSEALQYTGFQGPEVREVADTVENGFALE